MHRDGEEPQKRDQRNHAIVTDALRFLSRGMGPLVVETHNLRCSDPHAQPSGDITFEKKHRDWFPRTESAPLETAYFPILKGSSKMGSPAPLADSSRLVARTGSVQHAEHVKS